MNKTMRSLAQLAALAPLSFFVAPGGESEAQVHQWIDPFEIVSEPTATLGDTLTLTDVLRLVATSNPALKANKHKIEASKKLVHQAGLIPNPEFGIEAEEVSGDASGFRESEINIILSQELELWGKRGARKSLASSKAKSVRYSSNLLSFDLYAETVDRFRVVQHEQEVVELSRAATQISQSIAQTAKLRVDKGASLASEYILGQLEFERSQLDLEQAESELITAKERLSSMWNDSRIDFSAQRVDSDFTSIANLERLEPLIEGSREVELIDRNMEVVNASLIVQKSSAKPSLTVTGGMKRLEADGSNTLIVGAALPLPFFNRNQGSTAALRASIQALSLEREQAVVQTRASINGLKRQLLQSRSRYESLNSTLLPKAEETYNSLKEAYESGRIPYSILLESQRTLIELRFESNDLRLSINRQITAIERIVGVRLNEDR